MFVGEKQSWKSYLFPSWTSFKKSVIFMGLTIAIQQENNLRDVFLILHLRVVLYSFWLFAWNFHVLTSAHLWPSHRRWRQIDLYHGSKTKQETEVGSVLQLSLLSAFFRNGIGVFCTLCGPSGPLQLPGVQCLMATNCWDPSRRLFSFRFHFVNTLSYIKKWWF